MSTNIVVRIIGELKDAGFIKAEKRSSALEKKFDKLGKTAKRTFLAIAGIGALKKSITAFAAEDKAVRQLTVSLNNLGLAYNVPALEAFIKQTELATGVSGEQLRPAIRDLVATTLDAEQATQLLNTALDLAAGTGASLDATVNALTRAFNGNFASLGKIQTRYTSAELEAMGFAEAVATLNGEFKGTSAAAADSYQGKIDRLSTALGDASKIIGEDVLQALEKLADGDFDKVLSGIANAANFLGSAFNSLAFSLAYTREFLGTGFKIDAGEQAKLDAIKNQFFPTPGFGGTRTNPALLRDYAKQLDLQKKIVKERDKAVKLSEKDKKNQAALARAKAVFDLEKIQIEAALQGKITEEERVRLQLMKAIANENVDKVNELTNRLTELQAQTVKLATSLTTFKANDPFVGWDERIKDLSKQIDEMTKKRVMDFLANFTATNTFFINQILSGNPFINANANAAAATAAQANIDELLGDAEAARAQAAQARAEAEAARIAAEAAIAAARSEAERIIAEEAARAARAAADAAEAIEESAAALDAAAAARAVAEAERLAREAEQAAELFAAEAAARDAEAALLDSSLLFDTSVISAAAAGVPITEINVTVEGSIIAAEDLAETITDIQYTYQKTGKGLLFSSIAI